MHSPSGTYAANSYILNLCFNSLNDKLQYLLMALLLVGSALFLHNHKY